MSRGCNDVTCPLPIPNPCFWSTVSTALKKSVSSLSAFQSTEVQVTLQNMKFKYSQHQPQLQVGRLPAMLPFCQKSGELSLCCSPTPVNVFDFDQLRCYLSWCSSMLFLDRRFSFSIDLLRCMNFGVFSWLSLKEQFCHEVVEECFTCLLTYGLTIINNYFRWGHVRRTCCVW